ncbi:hypothetical protein Clacol_010108 [Clathrus columnatus]|uniref:Uncharacterized protein n=1 Tax=Clathrus columnatus TaxID=1419009 RepID=A0AAV5ASW4_9AGAM|nr:hypothetical protein Clacol_010108 [Clathrus columnatus]
MNGTVSSQLSEFSYQLSELQSLIIDQNKVHTALQEIHKGLLLHDRELEYQRKIQSLEQENYRLREMVKGWKSLCEAKEFEVIEWKEIYAKCREELLKNTNMPKEVLDSRLKIPPGTVKLKDNDAKLPVRSNSAQKSEDTSDQPRKPMNYFDLIGLRQSNPSQGIVDDKRLIDPSPRKRRVGSSDNGNDFDASPSQNLSTPTSSTSMRQVSPTNSERSNELADSVGTNRTPAPQQEMIHERPRFSGYVAFFFSKSSSYGDSTLSYDINTLRQEKKDMNGTVSSQLSEFSHQLSELQSLLINQSKVHAALQEIQKGLLLQDPELEYQRKNKRPVFFALTPLALNHRLEEMVEGWKSECELKERQVNKWKGKYTKCREELNQHLKRMDVPKEVLHSHLKMDVEPITPPSSFVKLPVQDRHIPKLEKLDVKIPARNKSISAKLEVDDSKLPIRDGNYARKSEDASVKQGRPDCRFVGPLVPVEVIGVGDEQFIDSSPPGCKRSVSSDNESKNSLEALLSQKPRTLTKLRRISPLPLKRCAFQVHPRKKQYARKSTGQKPPVYSLFDLSSSDDDSDGPVSYPTGRPRRSCQDRA